MVISLRKIWRIVKKTAAWLSLVLAIVLLFQLFLVWMQPQQPEHQPKGKAVKVSWMNHLLKDNSTMIDRLRFFYWVGE